MIFAAMFSLWAIVIALLFLIRQVTQLEHKVEELLAQVEILEPEPDLRVSARFIPGWRGHPSKPLDPEVLGTFDHNAVRTSDGWYCPKCGANSKSECPEQPEFDRG